MIDSKQVLREYLKVEEEEYRKIGYKGKLHSIITGCEVGQIVRYMKVLRKDEYYTNTQKNFIKIVPAIYYRRKHNKLGIKLGISIPVNTFGKGLIIYHSQSIIVHKDVRCGEYAKLHGLNCIGNNGSERYEKLLSVPQIGNGLDLGIGAIIIGNIKIGDHVKVAANAVVCKSCEKDNTKLIGIPANHVD